MNFISWWFGETQSVPAVLSSGVVRQRAARFKVRLGREPAGKSATKASGLERCSSGSTSASPVALSPSWTPSCWLSSPLASPVQTQNKYFHVTPSLVIKIPGDVFLLLNIWIQVVLWLDQNKNVEYIISPIRFLPWGLRCCVKLKQFSLFCVFGLK